MSFEHEDMRLPNGVVVRTGLLPATDEGKLFAANAPMFGEEFYLEDADIKKLLPKDTHKMWRRRRARWLINQNGLGSCFPAGTRVRMADGSHKPIEEVRLLDEVLTAEGNTGRVVRTYARPTIDLCSVSLWGHGHLETTEEHPFLTRRGYVPAQDLRDDDWVAIPKYAPQTTHTIHPYDIIQRPVGVNKERCIKQCDARRTQSVAGRKPSVAHRKPIPEEIHLDADFGWIIGIFLAEGSLNYAKLTFSLHRKEEHTLAARIVQIFRDKFGVEPTVVVRNNRCEVKVYGSLWTSLFFALCGYGSKGKVLHPSITSAGEDFLRGVLHGWMQGDGLGDPAKDGGVTISHDLALAMYDIANYLGYMPRIETLIPRINPKHKIKTRQKRYIIAWAKSGTSIGATQDDTHVWRRVRKVTRKVSPCWVFNIEVEGDNSYTAEGVGVHNCNAAATVGAFQNRRDVEGLKHVPLSVNYLYMHINGGSDSGSALSEGIKYAARGIAPVKLQVEGREWIFPHKSYRTSQISAAQMAAAKAEAANYVAHEAFKLPVGNYTMFKRAVASALARDFQIVHAWHVGGNSMSLRNGYIVQGRGPGNHATLGHSATYVGGEDIVHIDVQNSWCRTSDPIYGPTGSDWGEDGGFGLMTMQDFYACAKYHDYWVFTGSVKNEGSLV